ncbi:MAG: sugar ABC transporter permease [Candidatus Hydrogenedentes bacterium]|nr:sugar ABC transporter permease [Candidatus Hydrogenedentota bacterium]
MRQHPWLFLFPALLIMSISAFVPMMTVVNYSLHNIFAGSSPEFVGLENYAAVLSDADFRGALVRQLFFTVTILLIEIPLGVLLAHAIPHRGSGMALSLVLLGIPLLIPFNVVGIVWRLFAQSDIGVIPSLAALAGYDYNVSLHAVDAWLTLVALDVWHWTPLAALLAFSGLQAIPPAYYQAAAIDGASTWSTFRHVTLPRLRPVLTIGVLLRFMDSFTIYSEPLTLTGGGPGNTTTFLSFLIARKASSYELGYAGAASIIYLYIVIVLSYVFFQLLSGKQGATAR